jgi:hypothetical protein
MDIGVFLVLTIFVVVVLYLISHKVQILAERTTPVIVIVLVLVMVTLGFRLYKGMNNPLEKRTGAAPQENKEFDIPNKDNQPPVSATKETAKEAPPPQDADSSGSPPKISEPEKSDDTPVKPEPSRSEQMVSAPDLRPVLEKLDKLIAAIDGEVKPALTQLNNRITSLENKNNASKDEQDKMTSKDKAIAQGLETILGQLEQLNMAQEDMLSVLSGKVEENKPKPQTVVDGDITRVTLCRGEGSSARLFSNQVLIRLLSSLTPGTADFNITLPHSGILRIHEMQPGSRRPLEVNQKPYFVELKKVERQCVDIEIYPRN